MPTKLTPLAQAHTRRSLQKLLTTLHKKALRPAINKFTILIHADAFGHNTIFGRLQINDGDDVFLDRLIILWQFLICGLPYTLHQAKNDVFTVRFSHVGMDLCCHEQEIGYEDLATGMRVQVGLLKSDERHLLMTCSDH